MKKSIKGLTKKLITTHSFQIILYILKTLSTLLKKTAWFTGFPAKAAKLTSANLTDPCSIRLQSLTDVSDSLELMLPLSQSTPTPLDTTRHSMKSTLLIVALTGILLASKRQFT